LFFSTKGRRSLDRAISSSSTHRSNRHRRQSQHQQQQSPAPQSSVSYVANKVSFSLVNESNLPLIPTTNKQNEDEYELINTEDNDQHYHHQHVIIPRESIDDDEEEENEDIGNNNNNNNEEEEEDDDDDDPVVVKQLREQANVMVSNILASVIDQIRMTPNN